MARPSLCPLSAQRAESGRRPGEGRFMESFLSLCTYIGTLYAVGRAYPRALAFVHGIGSQGSRGRSPPGGWKTSSPFLSRIRTKNPIGQFRVAYDTRICPSASGASWRASSHPSFQLGQRQPLLCGQTLVPGDRLAVRIGSAMKRIVDDVLPGSRVLPNMKLSLHQAKRDAFAALVQHEECNDFFSHAEFDLTGNRRLAVAENAAAMHDVERVLGQRTFPDFGHLQSDPGVNASGGIALAAFAQDRAMHDERRVLGELFNRQRL